jgi:hypothetical protein
VKESDQIDAWRTTLGVQTGGDFDVTDQQRRAAALIAVGQEVRGLQDRADTIAILQMLDVIPTEPGADTDNLGRRRTP